MTLDEEHSLVCPTRLVPSDVIERSDGWKAFKIQEAIVYDLASSNRGMRTEQIAEVINAKGLFHRKGEVWKRSESI